MDLHKFGIKFFMTDPHAVPAQDFIPIFQHWIQGQVIPDHLLVDVHNYSHMHNGPGILLVAHEGNFSIDMADGRTGLLYIRKYPGKDLASIVKTARHACSLLEKEPASVDALSFGLTKYTSLRMTGLSRQTTTTHFPNYNPSCLPHSAKFWEAPTFN